MRVEERQLTGEPGQRRKTIVVSFSGMVRFSGGEAVVQHDTHPRPVRQEPRPRQRVRPIPQTPIDQQPGIDTPPSAGVSPTHDKGQ
ncbi:MAG: hypothetical protein ACRDQ5_12700 [Sciscionella sp.]